MSNYDVSFAQNRHEKDQNADSNLDNEVQDLYGSMEIDASVPECRA